MSTVAMASYTGNQFDLEVAESFGEYEDTSREIRDVQTFETINTARLRMLGRDLEKSFGELMQDCGLSQDKANETHTWRVPIVTASVAEWPEELYIKSTQSNQCMINTLKDWITNWIETDESENSKLISEISPGIKQALRQHAELENTKIRIGTDYSITIEYQNVTDSKIPEEVTGGWWKSDDKTHLIFPDYSKIEPVVIRL